MNKQELINKLKKQLTTPSEIKGGDFDCGHNYGIELATIFARQLEEPEKPVVPRFVADFYESIKDDFEVGMYDLCVNLYTCNLEGKIKYWFDCDDNKPIETLAKMKFYGYEVEKEQLYTVEIPNPNGDGYGVVYLGRNEYNKIELRIWDCYSSIEFADNWKQFDSAQLTESEINEDFCWAWQFAKEVKE